MTDSKAVHQASEQVTNEQVSIFLDTNCLLHFFRFDQIDWLSLTRSRRCRLVVCPVLLRELEKIKVFHGSPKLRERAGSAIAYLASLAEQEDPVFVRDEVEAHFVDHDALIDFTENRLVRDLADDQLIASAVEYQHETATRTLIASDDAGLGIKLRSRTVGLLKLPDTARLPSVMDAERSELADLRRRLARLQARAPRLSLAFDDGSTLLHVPRSECPSDQPRGLAEIMRAHPLQPLPPEEEYDRYAELRGGIAFGGGMMARLALEGRNELLERYFSKYRSFLKKHEAWALAFQTMYDVGFRLVNGGTGPATNVDVKIVFPSHIKILKTTSFPMEPDEPAAPSQADVDVPYAPMHERLFNQPFLPDISPHYDGCPSFEEGGRALEYDAATVKHGCDLVCDAVLFQVPLDRFDPFELNVSITYNEGDRVEHKLAVTFD